MENNKRRDFLKVGAAVGASLITAPLLGFSEVPVVKSGVANPGLASNERILGKGKHSLKVSALGLGCMSMTSNSYNPARGKNEMLKLIHSAAELGVTFFDTAEFYGPFTSEQYVGEALKPIRNNVVIASKLGFKFENGKSDGSRDSKPESIRKAVEDMLLKLKTDRLDLAYLHRVDPTAPIEEVAETVKDLMKEGKVLHFGLSEASHDNIRKATLHTTSHRLTE